MQNVPEKNRPFLANITVITVLFLIAVGLIWYGLSFENWQRVWRDLVERPGGPMTFRFILQPLMSTIAALHDGVADARTGRSPYFWTVLADPASCREKLLEGFVSTARIILLGLAMDAIYQFTVLKTFYPGEAVIIAILLAFIPYLLLRGPIARIARWRMARQTVSPTL